MANYFRITAYHPEENISAIFDSNGMFDKLWQFSAFLVSKGFKIIQASKDEFDFGNMPKEGYQKDKVILRAHASGQPDIRQGRITVGEKSYTIV